MSKAFFRFLRGELNGFYLNQIYNSLNKASCDISKFLYDFNKMQFSSDKMSEENIYNLGKFAGVFLPRLKAGEGGYGSMRMTSSNIVGNSQRSERGLLNRNSDAFKFFHTTQDDYEDDINTLSNINLKSSLVGTEEVKGYISSTEQNVVTDEGDIDLQKVISNPPTNEAYSDFYGNNFAYIADSNTKTRRNLNIELFLPLFEVMQYIRYNGQSLDSLCKIISIICPDGYVKIHSITKDANSIFFDVKYILDDSVDLNLKTQRIASMLYVVNLKFPQFTFTEYVY